MNLIEQYMNAKDKLAEAKKIEMDFRLKVAEMFSDQSEGVKTLDIEEFEVKCTFKNNITVDRDALDLVIDNMSAEELEAIDFKPTIKLGVYKKLDDTSWLETCLVVKPATPAIKVKNNAINS